MSNFKVLNGWRYNSGFEYEEGIFKDSCENKDDWNSKDWQKENGFDDEIFMTLGERNSNLWADVYVDRKASPHRYLIDMAISDQIMEPILTNLPGLLQLAKDITPLIELNIKVEDREEAFRKEEYKRKNQGK